MRGVYHGLLNSTLKDEFMIDLRRLQALRLVAREGSVTAAAQALYLTPSAVSQRIRQLSKELGVPLLVQEGRRVRLTPAAENLLRRADVIYAEWERIRADIDECAAGEAGSLHMCSFPSAIATVLAPTAAVLRDRHPHVDIRVTQAETDECLTLLLAQRADIAVLAPSDESPTPSDRKFEQVPLVDEPLDLLVWEGHPLSHGSGVELKDTSHEPWVVPLPDTTDHHSRILAYCAAAGFSPEIVHHAREWSAIAALVSQRLGVCLVPRLVRLSPDLEVVKVPVTGDPAPQRRMFACVRRGSRRNPTIVNGLQALEDVAKVLTDSDSVVVQ